MERVSIAGPVVVLDHNRCSMLNPWRRIARSGPLTFRSVMKLRVTSGTGRCQYR